MRLRGIVSSKQRSATLLANIDISVSGNQESFSRPSVAGYTGPNLVPFAQTAGINELRSGHYVGTTPCVLLETVPTAPQ